MERWNVIVQLSERSLLTLYWDSNFSWRKKIKYRMLYY